jgi:hypothetical protein
MKPYLILWLSVHNSIRIAGMLKNGFFRSLLPFRILEPLIFLIHEQRTDRLYAPDEIPDDLFDSIQEGDDQIARYTRPCSGLIFRASDLLLIRLLGLPGFVTDLKSSRVEHRGPILPFLKHAFAFRRKPC